MARRAGLHYTALDARLQRLAAMMAAQLTLDKTAGRYRVETRNSCRHVSPRLTAGAMLDWIEAGVAVMEHIGKG